jgi:NTE family protein
MEVLDDPKRQLVVPPPAVTRVGRAIASLEEIMDDLTHTIKPRALLSGHP